MQRTFSGRSLNATYETGLRSGNFVEISTEIIQGKRVVVEEDCTDAGPRVSDETAGTLSASASAPVMLLVTSTLVPRLQ